MQTYTIITQTTVWNVKISVEILAKCAEMKAAY